MANTFYITSGLSPNDSGETTTANTFYISAGLVPDDAGGGGGTIYSVLCSDGFTFADTTTKTALLQAADRKSVV